MVYAGVDFEHEETWIVAIWRGEVDMASAPAFEERTIHQVGNADEGLLIDLSGVGYIDSAGMRSLITISRLLDHRQQRLFMVVPADSTIDKALHIGGVKEVIRTFTSRNAAREAR